MKNAENPRSKVMPLRLLSSHIPDVNSPVSLHNHPI